MTTGTVQPWDRRTGSSEGWVSAGAARYAAIRPAQLALGATVVVVEAGVVEVVDDEVVDDDDDVVVVGWVVVVAGVGTVQPAAWSWARSVAWLAGFSV